MALTKIKADGLTADLIDETKLADNSIDSEHYNDGSIDNAHLADDAVGTAEIADDAVTADKLANAINTDIAAKAVLTGSTDNTITTVTGANAIQGEANLTFDGSELTVTGDIHVSDASPGIKFTDTDASGGFGMVGVNNTSGSLVLRSDDGNALSSSFMGFEVDGGEKARITSGGNVKINDGNLVIGTSGHGIDFSATSGTGDSELLSDYEHGTFTPVLQHFISGGFAAPTYSAAGTTFGRYTKIGNIVHIRISFQQFNISNAHAASYGRIDGLPFASVNLSGFQCALEMSGNAFTQGGANFVTYWGADYLNSISNGVDVYDWAVLQGGADSYLNVTGSYEAA